MTKKSGKIIAVSAAALGASLVLAGCSGFDAAGSASSAAPSQAQITGTIKISSESGYAQFLEPQQAFAKAHSGVTFVPTQAPSNTYQTLVRAQLDSGTAPDIMDVWGGKGNAMGVGQLAPKGYLADVSDQSYAKSMPAVVAADMSVDGKLYGYAPYVLATGVAYNTDLAKKLGVRVPETFDDVLSMCKKVSAKGVIPITLGNQTGSTNELVPGQLANDIIYSQDPKWPTQVESGSQKFSGDSLWGRALKQGVEEYKQMNDAGCFEKNSTGVSGTEAYQQVADGKALGTDIFANAIPGITADNPGIKLSMYSLPATNNANQTWVTGDIGLSTGVNAKSANMAASKAYVEFLATPAESAKEASANYGFPTSAAKSTKLNSTLTGLAKSYDAGRFALFPSAYYPNYNVKLTIVAQMEGLIAGSTTVDKAMAAIQTSYAGQ